MTLMPSTLLGQPRTSFAHQISEIPERRPASIIGTSYPSLTGEDATFALKPSLAHSVIVGQSSILKLLELRHSTTVADLFI